MYKHLVINQTIPFGIVLRFENDVLYFGHLTFCYLYYNTSAEVKGHMNILEVINQSLNIDNLRSKIFDFGKNRKKAQNYYGYICESIGYLTVLSAAPPFN